MPARSRSTPGAQPAPGAAGMGEVPSGSSGAAPANGSGTDALRWFSPVTREWFAGAFSEPTPAQAGAWAAIAAGQNTLVVAPTGSGKTLAAFLWALDRLAAGPHPADPKLRCRVLYISPLKALAVDIERNLRAPLTGLRRVARSRGLPEPDIRVAVRTGDTAADERRRLPAKPPDILITTPESLFLILTSKARDALRGVDTVIVDEVHALAGNKRGAHLALSLERLDALRQSGVTQRIGLSATVRPAEEVARFLAGSRPVTITAPAVSKRIELRIVVPVEDMTDPGPLPIGQPSAVPLSPASITPANGLEGSPARPSSSLPGGPSPGGPSGTASGGLSAGPPGQRSLWPHVEEAVLGLIEQHRSTIVFANSRRLAERLCGRLNELAAERALAPAQALAAEGSVAPHSRADYAGNADRRPPAEIMAQAGSLAGAPAEVARAHHGSVSRQERIQIEEALKAGRLPAVVATSSLELGIDMGAVDLVIQVESPPSVASGLQRTGRSGHNVGDVSRSVIFPKYPGDLVQAAVVAQRMRGGEIEELRIPRNPLDVLAQQIVAMTAMDEWRVTDLELLVRRAAPFNGLTRPVLEAVLDMLAGRYPSEEFAELRPRLVWDRTAGTLYGRPGAQRLAVTSGGTIPDRGLFGVFLAAAQRQGRHSHRVGELDEEMVYESRVGDVFVLGASSWRIEDITADQVLVSPAPGQPGKLPFWHGDAPGRPVELGRALGAFCRELAAAGTQQAAQRLRSAGLDDLAATNLVRYLDAQREATGYLPDDRTLVMERFRDELGDWRLVLHSPFGARVHAPWALAIATRLRDRYQGMDVQALHTDDGIVLRVPDTEAPPPAGIAELAPEEVEPLVTAELGGSALFASRFRECAARALLLPRRHPGKRSPLWQQRQRSAQLLAVASQYGSFPIVLETVRECLQDIFDVPALAGLMRDLASRRLRLVEVETTAPSPFARSLLFRYVGAFMYEGDSPLAERRAQALALDSSLLAELLGQADLRELLDPAIVSQTQAELQRLTASRACRDGEDVADLLRGIGPLSAAEVAQRCKEPSAAVGWLSELAAHRRAVEVRVGGEARWAAIEDAGRLRDALGVPLPPGIPAVFTEPVAEPLSDLVSRYARSHGPFTSAAVATRYGLGTAVVSAALHRLAAQGRIAEGEFLPGGRGTEWCDVEVLRLLRRRCLAKLRREAEPVPPEALASFLPAWQNAGQQQRAAPGEGSRAAGTAPRPGKSWRSAGPDAVYDAVAQLAGAAVPASALETLVLPGRIPGYQPAVLDELTAAGEVVWSGAGGLPGGDGWVVLTPAHTASLLLPAPAEITMTPVHEAVLSVLDSGGGLFFRMLADRVAGLLTEKDRRGFSDAAVAAAIWDLVWAGLLTNDTLAPLRTVLSTGRPVHTGAGGGIGGSGGVGSGTGGAGHPGGVGYPGSAGHASGAAEAAGDAGPAGHANGSGPISGGPVSGSVHTAPGGFTGSGHADGGGLAGGGLGTSGLRTGGRYGLAGRGAGRRHGYGRPMMPTRTGPPTVTGRWSLLPERETDPTRRLHALAQAMLDRHGLLTRGAVMSERVPGGFGTLYPVLRAMEEAGQCRRGYFVEGLGAAQFALPGAVDRMRALASQFILAPQAHAVAAADAPSGVPDPGGSMTGHYPGPSGSPAAGHYQGPSPPSTYGPQQRRASPGTAPHGETPADVVVLAAADPANPYGAALPWPDRPGEVPGAHRPGRKAGALVVLCRGRLVLYVERGGKTLLSWTSDPAMLAPAAAGLANAVRGGVLGRLTVERADGSGVYDTPLAQALADAGFRPTPRGLRLRGS